MTLEETPQEAPLLHYGSGYWTGSDSQVHLKLPSALFRKHYHAELRERGIANLTAQDAGRRALAFHECRKLSYWNMVDDPKLIRTPLAQSGSPDHQRGD